MINKAYIYTAICIISWALIPVCSKKVLSGMDVFSMMLFSNLISSVTMAFYLKISNKLPLLSKYSPKDYLYMIFLGFLGTFLYYILLYGAFSVASAQEVFIINYLWPILVVIFAVFILKERLTLIKIVSISISFLGVVIIATKGRFDLSNFGSIMGDLLALLGAASFASFSVLGKGSKYDNTIAVFVYFASSFVFSFICAPFMHPLNLNISVVFWLIINGIFVNGISYLFWFNALKLGKTHIVSNLVYLTPFVSLLFISIFLNEKIHIYSFEALVLIILGIAIQSLMPYFFKRYSSI
jgi:drug/metabolite transporter (DMT)-like permease